MWSTNPTEGWDSRQCREQNNLLTYVNEMKEGLHGAREMTQAHLKASQTRMKVWYDRRASNRQFNVDDQVLALLPVSGNPLKAKYIGPCKVLEKIGSLDYVVFTPESRKPTRRRQYVEGVPCQKK